MQRVTIRLCVITLIILTGCNPTPENIPIAAIDDDYTPMVSVTGTLRPVKWANVSAQTGGLVIEILVSDGDTVAEGAVLFKIDDQDARHALTQSQSALNVAKAQLTQMQRGPQGEDIAVADAQLVAAQTAISQTISQRESLDAGGYTVQLAALNAQVEALKVERFLANQQHEDSMKCYGVQQPDGTSKEHCPTLGTIEEQLRKALHVADVALLSAETQRDHLYSEHRANINIADAGVKMAQAQVLVAQAQLAVVIAPASPENIAIAQAIVDQAQISVDIAQFAISRTEVRAPIAGVIGNLIIHEGEVLAPGIPVAVIGDLDNLRVETTDLDEIDVAQIETNQNAVVTFEAVPDETFIGTVDYISPIASPGSGGVNYTVYLSLDKRHPSLRWGMTAFVDIKTSD